MSLTTEKSPEKLKKGRKNKGMFKKIALGIGALIVLLIGWKWATYQWWGRPDRLPLAVEPVHLDCRVEQTAALIAQKKRLPSSVLFHYGQRDVLNYDVAADTVPEEAWNDFIMGEKTRFHLKPFRRGLYGTETLEDADRFGGAKEGKLYNGLIAIVLNPACLKVDRVETLLGLPENPRFRQWYESKKFSFSFRDWSRMCFDAEGNPVDSQFKLYDSEKLDQTTCESTVEQHYNDLNIAFVQDTVISRSWAIRDRSCIAHIRGDDEFWAREFYQDARLWSDTCDPEVNHRNRLRVWFQALANFDFARAPQKPWNEVLFPVPRPKEHYDHVTDETDDFAAQEFAMDFDAAVLRCTEKKRTDEFKKALLKIAQLVENLQSKDVKYELDHTCR
jgi:hypothetical protein